MAGPLDDVVVIDLTRALAGPHCAMMLGDMGARVIKVENPGGGDESRGWGPPFVGPDDEPVSTYFLSCNRNKESVTLDLKTDDGRETLARLVTPAVGLLANSRAGGLVGTRCGGVCLHELNPGLVLLSISGFGHDGPQGGRAGYDQIAQGEGGLMSLTGADPEHPQRVGVPIGDLLAGMYGAYGVVSALHERNRTGKGRVVRTSLLASIVGVHAFQGTRYTVAGEVGAAGGNHHPSICPYGLFTCADGMIQLACGSEGLWVKLAEGFGLDPFAPGFATNRERVGNRELVGGAHVGHRNVQVPAVGEHRDVGAGGVGGAHEVAAVDTGGGGAIGDGLTGRVVADGGDEHGGPAEAGEVLRDVAAHPADRGGRRPRVARAEDRGASGAHLGVEDCAADDEHGVGLGAQQVAATADDPLLHEVGQVHRDRGPGGADALGQGCGVEHGVGTQQGDDLVFASSQFHIGILKEPWVYKQGVALLEVAGHRVSATCRVR